MKSVIAMSEGLKFHVNGPVCFLFFCPLAAIGIKISQMWQAHPFAMQFEMDRFLFAVLWQKKGQKKSMCSLVLLTELDKLIGVGLLGIIITFWFIIFAYTFFFVLLCEFFSSFCLFSQLLPIPASSCLVGFQLLNSD